MTRTIISIAALLASTSLVQAASMPASPPKPTETSTVCTDDMVWDSDAQVCVIPEPAMFDDDTLYGMARELAYSGRYDDAIDVLRLAQDQTDPRIQTYYGFAHRKAGRSAVAMQFYTDVIATHPDNLLARSYYGQALLQDGNHEGAWKQLAEITARGGAGSWAHQDLVHSLRNRRAASY
jgi:tetratricopeptide (TPR) repeat protein